MPVYSVSLSRTAARQLDRLPLRTAETLLEAIQSLAENPRPQGVKKLKGREGFRIRRGDYRIIYDIHDRQLVIEVVAIGHRKDIYE
jgi:mRNA interferase RelE/StbE